MGREGGEGAMLLNNQSIKQSIKQTNTKKKKTKRNDNTTDMRNETPTGVMDDAKIKESMRSRRENTQKPQCEHITQKQRWPQRERRTDRHSQRPNDELSDGMKMLDGSQVRMIAFRGKIETRYTDREVEAD